MPAASEPVPETEPASAHRDDDAVSAPVLDETVLARWLDTQCRMLPGVESAVAAFELDPDGRPLNPTIWPATATPLASTLDVAAMAFARKVPIVAQLKTDAPAGGVGLNVGHPLVRGATVYGVVAVNLVVPAKQQQAVVRALRDGVRWLDVLLRPARTASSPALIRSTGDDVAFTDLIVEALEQPSVAGAELTVVAALAAQLGCERVALGWRRRGHITLASLSDVHEVDRRVDTVHQIEACMDEACAQACVVSVPELPSNKREFVSHHGHDVLSRAAGGARVCTVPLQYEDAVVGALTFEHSAPADDEKWVQACARAGHVLVAPLALKRAQDQGLLSATASRATARLRGRPFIRGLMIVIGLIAGFGVAGRWALSEDTYVIAGPAVLEGSVQRALAAPFDGFLAAVNAKAGEVVRKHQVLARLDVDEIDLEIRRLSADRDALDKRHRQALAALAMSEARIVHAQIAQVDARLDLARGQRARASLRAPFEGIIVRGDLTRALGKPVARGEVLLEVAPLDSYRVTVEVEARDIASVFVHQSGRLRLAALPDQSYAIEVRNIAAVAGSGADEGQFRVEAALEGPSARLRPGMHGIARLEVGNRPRVEGWVARLVAPVRLWWWRWSP